MPKPCCQDSGLNLMCSFCSLTAGILRLVLENSLKFADVPVAERPFTQFNSELGNNPVNRPSCNGWQNKTAATSTTLTSALNKTPSTPILPKLSPLSHSEGVVQDIDLLSLDCLIDTYE